MSTSALSPKQSTEEKQFLSQIGTWEIDPSRGLEIFRSLRTGIWKVRDALSEDKEVLLSADFETVYEYYTTQFSPNFRNND